jgi:hypothetical protein
MTGKMHGVRITLLINTRRGRIRASSMKRHSYGAHDIQLAPIADPCTFIAFCDGV